MYLNLPLVYSHLFYFIFFYYSLSIAICFEANICQFYYSFINRTKLIFHFLIFFIFCETIRVLKNDSLTLLHEDKYQRNFLMNFYKYILRHENKNYYRNLFRRIFLRNSYLYLFKDVRRTIRYFLPG